MPQTVFTDQDQAMAKTLVEVMPWTYHGLCTCTCAKCNQSLRKFNERGISFY